MEISATSSRTSTLSPVPTDHQISDEGIGGIGMGMGIAAQGGSGSGMDVDIDEVSGDGRDGGEGQMVDVEQTPVRMSSSSRQEISSSTSPNFGSSPSSLLVQGGEIEGKGKGKPKPGDSGERVFVEEAEGRSLVESNGRRNDPSGSIERPSFVALPPSSTSGVGLRSTSPTSSNPLLSNHHNNNNQIGHLPHKDNPDLLGGQQTPLQSSSLSSTSSSGRGPDEEGDVDEDLNTIPLSNTLSSPPLPNPDQNPNLSQPPSSYTQIISTEQPGSASASAAIAIDSSSSRLQDSFESEPHGTTNQGLLTSSAAAVVVEGEGETSDQVSAVPVSKSGSTSTSFTDNNEDNNPMDTTPFPTASSHPPTGSASLLPSSSSAAAAAAAVTGTSVNANVGTDAGTGTGMGMGVQVGPGRQESDFRGGNNGLVQRGYGEGSSSSPSSSSRTSSSSQQRVVDDDRFGGRYQPGSPHPSSVQHQNPSSSGQQQQYPSSSAFNLPPPPPLFPYHFRQDHHQQQQQPHHQQPAPVAPQQPLQIPTPPQTSSPVTSHDNEEDQKRRPAVADRGVVASGLSNPNPGEDHQGIEEEGEEDDEAYDDEEEGEEGDEGQGEGEDQLGDLRPSVRGQRHSMVAGPVTHQQLQHHQHQQQHQPHFSHPRMLFLPQPNPSSTATATTTTDIPRSMEGHHHDQGNVGGNEAGGRGGGAGGFGFDKRSILGPGADNGSFGHGNHHNQGHNGMGGGKDFDQANVNGNGNGRGGGHTYDSDSHSPSETYHSPVMHHNPSPFGTHDSNRGSQGEEWNRIPLGGVSENTDFLSGPNSANAWSSQAHNGDHDLSLQPQNGQQQPYGNPRYRLEDLSDSPDGVYGKPKYPYVTLLRYAILGSPKGRLTLGEIYEAIEARYPYYANAGKGWKNSVRHNLSVNKCFKKQSRHILDPGKGAYWFVDEQEEPSTSRTRPRKRAASGVGFGQRPFGSPRRRASMPGPDLSRNANNGSAGLAVLSQAALSQEAQQHHPRHISHQFGQNGTSGGGAGPVMMPPGPHGQAYENDDSDHLSAEYPMNNLHSAPMHGRVFSMPEHRSTSLVSVPPYGQSEMTPPPQPVSVLPDPLNQGGHPGFGRPDHPGGSYYNTSGYYTFRSSHQPPNIPQSASGVPGYGYNPEAADQSHQAPRPFSFQPVGNPAAVPGQHPDFMRYPSEDSMSAHMHGRFLGGGMAGEQDRKRSFSNGGPSHMSLGPNPGYLPVDAAAPVHPSSHHMSPHGYLPNPSTSDPGHNVGGNVGGMPDGRIPVSSV